MYNGTKVFDVHGHVTPTPHRNAFLVNLLTSNAAQRSPLSGGRSGGGNFGRQMEIGDDAYQIAAESHAKYLDDRNIDVQIIGPRPFTMLGWMHLTCYRRGAGTPTTPLPSNASTSRTVFWARRCCRRSARRLT
jgi:hypothetical protein